MASSIELPTQPPLPPGQPRARPAKPKIKKLRAALIATGVAFLAMISTVFGMMMAVASDLPALEDKEQYKVAKPSTLVDRSGKPIAFLRNNDNRILVQSGAISASMKQAIVAIEDRRFYTHKGVDFRGIGRALYTDIVRRSARQGASTITQQFVKNALVAQSNRTVFQKLRESALAYHLERQWDKDKILTNYLNTIYFGNGAYGIEAAARTYFGSAHPGCQAEVTRGCASQLRPGEAALLAGMVASPTAFDPVVHPVAATNRRDTVLKAMQAQGHITGSIYEDAVGQAVPSESEIDRPREDSAAPYFSTWVRQQLVDRYDAGLTFGGGLRVRTTLDLDLQRAAEQAVNSRLPAGGPSAALVAIENKTGKIRAMVGGSDYNEKPFNLATQARRQPGSAFKTFTLVAALQKGYGLGSTWSSRKKILYTKNDRFEVHNYEDAYAGTLTLGSATAASDNSVFAEVGLKVGTRRIAKLAHRMGVTTPISTNAAMTLGGLRIGVSPLEMAHAYATLANGGKRPSSNLAAYEGGPAAIERVDRGSRVFRNQKARTKSERVFKESVANIASSALQGVIRGGTGKAAAIGSFAAGKTGTTENYGDAWFVGFNEKLTVAIWVGYPESLKYMLTEYHGKPVAGGTYPAEIWRDFMAQVLQIFRARDAEGSSGATGSLPAPVAPGAAPKDKVEKDKADEPSERPRRKAPAPQTKPEPEPEPVPAPPPGAGGGVAPVT